jgi:PAS domain S-box-containing protein
MKANPATPLNLVKVRGTELLSSDSRERYRQKLARITLDSMVQFVGLLDANGTVLEINHVALDAVGIKLSEVEGKPFWTTFWWQVSGEINATLRDAIRRAAQGEFVRWDAEIYGRAGGKETIIIDASLMPVKDEQGTVVFITAEGRDITEKKAHEREIARQREELAKLDQLKTQFFANISHEFRTPLTLMMGPLEDALAQPKGMSAENRERMQLAHRNSLRLLKLVNTLLDFSRIEAGRIQASYEPTDLAALTAELASVFRSAIERAGMRLIIDCSALPDMVYVDREMWEKIVLNLLSNAFKFTFEGEIEVSLRATESVAELTVRDTGTGVPADELPQLFERFHRVKGARGRSYEGSGIGLALVQELVKLHGGAVQIESEVDRGTTFTVTIPLGKDHLPADRIGGARTLASTGVSGDAYVQEALRWLPDRQDIADDVQAEPLFSSSESLPHFAQGREQRRRILLADDNADMREYVQRLLRGQYEVVAVADGESALASAREQRPDLILCDIMMPQLDGFGVLQGIRAEESLKHIPVILLSARAGEEARIEGLSSGADDYLVKPFSARELLARVGSHLTVARIRGEAAGLERKLRLDAEMLAAIVASSDDAIVSKNLDGVITSWNKGAERIFGYTAEEAVGQHITLIIPHDRREEEAEILARLRRGEQVDHFHTVRRRKDGSTLDISATISPLRDSAGNVFGASKVARDISKQKRTEEASRESEEKYRQLAETLDTEVRARTKELEERNREVLRQSDQLRELSWRLLRTQEEERRHIARELHDSAGQTLTVLGMSLAQLVQNAGRSAPELATEAESIQETVQQLHRELRTASYLLHPPLLDETGLYSALSWYVQGLVERSGLDVSLDIPKRFGRLPQDMELAVFRLVQECLTNVHRHSGSKTALIRVAREGDLLAVTVEDQGKGMTPARLAETQSQGSGVGIRGMRERLRQFHGTMIVESDSSGTRILVTIPIPKAASQPASGTEPVKALA